MAKKADNTVLDALLTEARTATEVYVCNGEPTDGGNVAIDAVKQNNTPGSPTFGAITGAGGAGGFREYLNQQIDNVTLDNVTTNPGNATHVATRVGTTLKMVTTINGGTGTPVAQNDIVDVGEWTHTVNAPV